MRGRTGLRVRTDFDVVAWLGGMKSHCRAIDLSTSGVLVDRGRQVRPADERLMVDLELLLPESAEALHAVGRSVWSQGTMQAFCFVGLDDVDRLTLAEHIDRRRAAGVAVS
jgi:hypothetical protein